MTAVSSAECLAVIVVSKADTRRNSAEFLRVSAFETTITARHSAEETAVIRSLTGMANNLNQLTRLSHQAGFHRTQRAVTELLQKLKEIIVRYRHGERRPS